jgi:hypothetical protein
MGGVSVIAFVLLLSFAIDRVVAGILFALSWSERWRNLCPDADELADPHEKAAAQQAQKTAYFVFAALFSVVLLRLVGSGILAQMGFMPGNLDLFLTALIVMGGAERVSAFSTSLQPSSEQVVSEPPLHITGTLTLEEGTIRRLRGEDA